MSVLDSQTFLPQNAQRSNVPLVEKTESSDIAKGKKGASDHWMMIACCVPMFAVAGVVVWQNGIGADLKSTLTAIAPLAVCIGAHLLMHKKLGKSCHGKNSQIKKEQSNEKPH